MTPQTAGRLGEIQRFGTDIVPDGDDLTVARDDGAAAGLLDGELVLPKAGACAAARCRASRRDSISASIDVAATPWAEAGPTRHG